MHCALHYTDDPSTAQRETVGAVLYYRGMGWDGWREGKGRERREKDAGEGARDAGERTYVWGEERGEGEERRQRQRQKKGVLPPSLYDETGISRFGGVPLRLLQCMRCAYCQFLSGYPNNTGISWM